MRRRQLQQQIQNNRMAPLSSIAGSPIQRSINTEALFPDSLTVNASRRSTGNRKRSMSSNGDKTDQSGKRFRENSSSKQSDAMMLAEESLDNMVFDSDLNTKPRASRNTTHSPSEITFEAQALEGFQELLNAQEKELEQAYESPEDDEADEDVLFTKGTIDGLIEAGKAEREVDDAATVMVTLNDVGELSDSDLEESGIGSGSDDEENAVVINLPGFKSKLPQLPIEPVPEETGGMASPGKRSPRKTSPQKLTDKSKEDEKNAAVVSDDKEIVSGSQNGSPEKVNGEFVETNRSDDIQTETIQPILYPYPVDTWWPSIPAVRREGKSNGEETDQDNFVEEPGIFRHDSLFYGDTKKIRDRLANDVEPGVLEKIPHCKIHRLKTRAQKGANIPDHAFCWQVTETYCTDVMVCCSICSTWRHAGCGGHYKAYSVRESIETKQPFEAICDLCHEEQVLLQEYPRGETRLKRQRIEQLRRALSTSAVIRQAAFVKYGGTYKWPLGSVSSTHIGGHTRSVHSRHDKAEKTWSDMTSRLARDNRPKERVKTRTREFERLLVCLEDAEGLMERHNMIQFLENDTRKQDPAGYEQHLRNLFDPDDDEHPGEQEELFKARSQDSQEDEAHREFVGRKPPARWPGKDTKREEAICARRGCCKKPRFDSLFCSDACGVSELERDLLRAMYIAGELHPSLMRG
jgi:hypothetical protein